MNDYPIANTTFSSEMVSVSQKRRRERERWNALACSMPDFYSTFSTQYYRRREIAQIQRAFGHLRGKRVLKLDLWNEAVNTRILNWMQSQGAEAFGVDFSRVTVERAHRNANGAGETLHMVVSDIRDLPFEDNSFDFVYTMGTIEHMDEYEEAIEELRRVLKAEGKAIIGVPYKWDIFLRPLLVNIMEFFGKYPYTPEKSFSAKELCRVVERSSLIVRHRTGIMAFPGILRIAEIFCYWRRIPLYQLTSFFLRPFEYMESRWEWMRLFGYLIVIEAEKVSS